MKPTEKKKNQTKKPCKAVSLQQHIPEPSWTCCTSPGRGAASALPIPSPHQKHPFSPFGADHQNLGSLEDVGAMGMGLGGLSMEELC